MSYNIYYNNVSKVYLKRNIYIVNVVFFFFSIATSRERTESKPLCVRLWTATPSGLKLSAWLTVSQAKQPSADSEGLRGDRH